MPTVSIDRDRLFELLEEEYSREAFDELCFEFGLELDDVETETPASGGPPRTMYKVEVPANRYDLLCIEGLAQALRVFLQKDDASPNMQLSIPTADTETPTPIKITVKPSTNQVRPYIVGAVLRDIEMDTSVYDSLIDLQEKLHQNICRRRTLVAIGTHDLDMLQPPFCYDAQTPDDISFVPLRPNDKEYTASQLMEVYKEDAQLKKYLHILEAKPKYPVLLDSEQTVLSMPPIINGDKSRISTSTRNIFIECTATDETKANIVLNTIVAMFAGYCKNRFVVEPVTIVYEEESERQVRTPDFSTPQVTAQIDYINRSIGVDIPGENMIQLLRRMQLPASCKGNTITVDVPIIRSDILHACDIMNDVAIGYGFNEVPEQMPKTSTIGRQQPLNHLSDLVRREGFAQQGYTEVLTWVTVSNAENFSMLRREEEIGGKTGAVKIGNPKTLEFQECRTSLLPGLFKTLRENRKSKVPIKLFEVGDVVLKDTNAEVLASNRRKMAAVYCSTSAGFEVIQGLLEHVMQTLDIPKMKPDGGEKRSWVLDPDGCENPTFMPKRRANVVFNGQCVGAVGWIHPEVLKNFSLSYPCSAFEVDLQSFL